MKKIIVLVLMCLVISTAVEGKARARLKRDITKKECKAILKHQKIAKYETA